MIEFEFKYPAENIEYKYELLNKLSDIQGHD